MTYKISGQKIKCSNTQTDKSANALVTRPNGACHQRNMSKGAPETKGARCVNTKPYKKQGNGDKMVTVNEIRGAGVAAVTDPDTVHDSRGILWRKRWSSKNKYQNKKRHADLRLFYFYYVIKFTLNILDLRTFFFVLYSNCLHILFRVYFWTLYRRVKDYLSNIRKKTFL